MNLAIIFAILILWAIFFFFYVSRCLFKMFRSSHQEVFLRKCVLKICSKFTGEHPCRNAISIKLQSNYIEIAFWHGCSPANLLHIFRTPFLKNTSRQLSLNIAYQTNHSIPLILVIFSTILLRATFFSFLCLYLLQCSRIFV